MDARTEPACPVCEEPLPGRPATCFRCETPLAQWWSFDEALTQARLPARPTVAGRRPAWVAGAALVAMAFGIAAAVVSTRKPPAPVALAPTAAVAPAAPSDAPRESPPARISYRVQRGDSLWRIAASLTGDGRRWRELWPQHEAAAGRIAPGTVLEVDLRRVAEAR
jgi:hypothetical protein